MEYLRSIFKQKKNLKIFGAILVLALIVFNGGAIVNSVQPYLVNAYQSLFASTQNNTNSGYRIKQWDGEHWQDVYTSEFQVEYSTQRYSLRSYTQDIQLRVVHEGGDFADIEYVGLDACGQIITPRTAYYIDSKESVLEDVVANDLNVAIAQEREIELMFSLPDSCVGEFDLLLTANAYTHANPFHYIYEGGERLRYKINSNEQSLIVDGDISETDGINEPLYAPFWEPATGHPDGITYIYVSNDQDYLYFTLDVTMDNTNELSQDFAEIIIGDATYRIDDTDTTFGECGFGVTSKAAYKHQVCEFTIPRHLVRAQTVEFEVKYYGTGGAPVAREPPVLGEDFVDDYYATTMFDTTIYEIWFREDGTGTPGTRTILSSGSFVDPPRYAMDMVKLSTGGFAIAYGFDESATGQGYDLQIARVTSPGVAAAFDVNIALRGENAGDFGVSKIIQMIADSSGGLYVLYLSGDVTPASEAGNVYLDHIDSAGTITNLGTFGWYNADMISDGSGGVYVLYNIGEEWNTGALSHGTVRRYNASGIVGGFGTVTVSTDTTTTKSGAVMIPSSDTSPEPVIFWIDNDATNPGIYGQKINSSGVIQYAARGALILNTTSEGAGINTSTHLRASSGFGFDSVYVSYKDGSGNWRIFEVDDASGSRNWACVQNFGAGDALALSQEMGISGGTRGVLAVKQSGTTLSTMLYDQADGDMAWSSVQTLASGTNTKAALQNAFYPSDDEYIRVNASGLEEDGSNGFDFIYMSGGTASVSSVNFDRSTYPAAAGGDCVIHDYYNAIVTPDITDNTVGVTKLDANSSESYAHALDISGTPPGLDLSSSNTGDETLFIETSTGTDVFIGWGEDQSGTGSWDLYVSKVTAALGETWSTLIEACGGFGNFHCSNNIRQLVHDGSGGVFVLSMTGDDLGGAGSTVLRHLNSAGTLSAGYPVTLTTGYNSGMVADGSGGVWVFYEMEYDGTGGTLGHGKARRYNSSGSIGSELSLSTNTTSEKSGAVAIDDGSGGMVVFWKDNQAGEQGIYAQRILAAGTLDPAWSARGEQLIATTSLGSDTLRASRNGTDLFYTYEDSSNVVHLAQTDLTPTAAWSCVQDIGTNINDYDIVPGGSGVFAVWEDNSGADNGVYGQHFDESTGNSTWAIGGVLLDDAVSNSGTSFEIILKSQYSSTGDFNFNPYTTAARQTAASGVNIVYSYSLNGKRSVYNGSYTTASYAAGAGNDCAAGGGGGGTPGGGISTISQALQAPIIDSVSVLGTSSVSYSWLYNGSNHTGFRIVDGDTALLSELSDHAVRNWTAQDLIANTRYSNQKVKAYNNNAESSLSESWPDAITHIIPVSLALTSHTESSASVQINETLTNLDLGDSGVFFQLRSGDDVIASALNESGWTKETAYTFDNLPLDDEIHIRAKARNQEGVETEWSDPITLMPISSEDALLSISLTANSVSGRSLSDLLPEDRIVAQINVANTSTTTATNVFVTLPLPSVMSVVPGSLFISGSNQTTEPDADQGQVSSGSLSAIFNELEGSEDIAIAFELDFSQLIDIRNENEQDPVQEDVRESVIAASILNLLLQASVSASNVPLPVVSNSIPLSVDVPDAIPVPVDPIPDPIPTPIIPSPDPVQPVPVPQPSTPPSPSIPSSSDSGGTEQLILTGQAQSQQEMIEFTGTTSEPNSTVTVTFNDSVTQVLISDENGVWRTFVSAQELGIEPGQTADVVIDALAVSENLTSNRLIQSVEVTRAIEGEVFVMDQEIDSESTIEVLLEDYDEEIVTTLTVLTPVILFSSPPLWGYLPYLPNLILHLIAWLMGLFRKKKEGRLYGIVYDSITKEPLPLSIVRVYSSDESLVSTQVTDKQGRYEFLLEPANYRVEVKKPSYTFPSSIVRTSIDGEYQHVYQKQLVIDDQTMALPDIPIDPEDAHQRFNAANIVQKLFLGIQSIGAHLAVPLLILGAIASLVTLWFQYTDPIHWILAVGYIVLLAVQLFLRKHPEKAWGIVYDLTTGVALPLVNLQLIDPEFGKIVKSRLSDYEGRFAFLPEPGKYIIKAIKPGYSQPEVVESSGDLHPIQGQVDIKREGEVIDGDIALTQIQNNQ